MSYLIEYIDSSNLELWQAGVRDISYWKPNIGLAETLKVVTTKTHKLLWWSWTSHKINEREWLNKCIIYLLKEAPKDVKYRILERIGGGDRDPADAYICVWENGHPEDYFARWCMSVTPC